MPLEHTVDPPAQAILSANARPILGSVRLYRIDGTMEEKQFSVPVLSVGSHSARLAQAAQCAEVAQLGRADAVRELQRLGEAGALGSLPYLVKVAPFAETLCSNDRVWSQSTRLSRTQELAVTTEGVGDAPANAVRVMSGGKVISATITSWVRRQARWEAVRVRQFAEGDRLVSEWSTFESDASSPLALRANCPGQKRRVSSTGTAVETFRAVARASEERPADPFASNSVLLSELPISCTDTSGPCSTEYIVWAGTAAALATAAGAVISLCAGPLALTPPCWAAWTAYVALSAAYTAAWNALKACYLQHGIPCNICLPATRIGSEQALSPGVFAAVNTTTSDPCFSSGDPSGGGGGSGGGGSEPSFVCQQWFWYEDGVAVAEWWECECVSGCWMT